MLCVAGHLDQSGGFRVDVCMSGSVMLAERKGFEPSMGFWPILP